MNFNAIEGPNGGGVRRAVEAVRCSFQVFIFQVLAPK